jgi:hypothetical protein
MNSELIEDILSFESEPKKEKIKEKVENISERIINTQDFKVKDVDLFVGQRVRMKENFNRLKENQLVEILGINKQQEIHIVSVYDGSKAYVTLDQIYLD